MVQILEAYMAWLCNFSGTSCVTPREVYSICKYPSRRSSWICYCSTKSSSRRKVKSNVELRSEIREFMLAVGLPDGHVPSFKDFADNGRNDLANIVRRRGYKHIRDLLSNATDLVTNRLTSYKVNSLSEVSAGSGPSNTLRDEMDQGPCKDKLMLSLNNIEANQGSKQIFPETLSSKFSSFVNPSMHEVSSIVHNDLLPGEDEISISEDISKLTETVNVEGHETKGNGISSSTLTDNVLSSSTSRHCSLVDEKVEKFILTGELDTVKDMEENYKVTEEISICTENNTERNLHHKVSGGDVALMMNEARLASQNVNSQMGHGYDWSNGLSPEVSINSFDQDIDEEFSKQGQQIDVEDLKSMLRQKELELSILKEQIEKEKNSLSSLQKKAEFEMRKAQELVVDKDTELISTEESLSGLVEVKVTYSGDAYVVEIAGSFNGWQHRIQLNPDPPINNGRSRKSEEWSALLWLYPGVYEIKFIVDGQWIVDPRMEMVDRGHFCNNVLRVTADW